MIVCYEIELGKLFLYCTIIVFSNYSSALSADPANAADPMQNLLLHPPLNAEDKIPVAIAFRLINLSNINEEEQHFDVVGYLIAEWQNPRLAFTPNNSQEKYRTYQIQPSVSQEICNSIQHS